MLAGFTALGLMVACGGSDPDARPDEEATADPEAKVTAIAARTPLASSPIAALYSLNDRRPSRFAQNVNSRMPSGGAHSLTWDGRVLLSSRGTYAWEVQVVRPERIQRSGTTVDFSGGVYSEPVVLESNDDNGLNHNWVAVTLDPSVKGENPYSSDANGVYRSDGAYRAYKALVYQTREVAPKEVGVRRASFVVRNPNSGEAEIASAKLGAFQPLRTTQSVGAAGNRLVCIEVTVTMDGRLLVCHGHPDNSGALGHLVYSWNPVGGAATGWSPLKTISDMHHKDRDVLVAGMKFKDRYPIAQSPLLDSEGRSYGAGVLFEGAYPWLSHDGSEIFYQATRNGEGNRRAGTSVIGRWTGFTARHIDGPVNTDRFASGRLFMSSPGAFTTMWSPYREVGDLPIPYSLRGPSYPLFVNPGSVYAEVSFEDFLDGNYVMYLSMNEQLDRSGVPLVTRTPDTSGHFNNATLVNAKFPPEYNRQAQIPVRSGQGIYFPPDSHLSIQRRDGWSSLANNGFTLDLFVNIAVSPSGAPVGLLQTDKLFSLFLDQQRRLALRVIDRNGKQSTISSESAIPLATWTHVAASYAAATKTLSLYADGQLKSQLTARGLGSLATGGAAFVGPRGSTRGTLILDEVKISNVVREPFEIAYFARSQSASGLSDRVRAMIPSHLASLERYAHEVSGFTTQRADLGEMLFSSTVLSKGQETSCATCHDPNRMFTTRDPVAQSKEPDGLGTRNAPMLRNRLFSTLQGWSGEAASLSAQALIPIEAPHEMNLSIDEAVTRLNEDPTGQWKPLFQAAYGTGQVTADALLNALASFQMAQFSVPTDVDLFNAGDLSTLTAAQRLGKALFEGKARCVGCHLGPNFTDESFRTTGLVPRATPDGVVDEGRSEITRRSRDRDAFKVPSLRGVQFTSPYMHNGSIATLAAVVNAYNRGGSPNMKRDSDIRPLQLTKAERTALVEYLKAL